MLKKGFEVDPVPTESQYGQNKSKISVKLLHIPSARNCNEDLYWGLLISKICVLDWTGRSSVYEDWCTDGLVGS